MAKPLAIYSYTSGKVKIIYETYPIKDELKKLGFWWDGSAWCKWLWQFKDEDLEKLKELGVRIDDSLLEEWREFKKGNYRAVAYKVGFDVYVQGDTYPLRDKLKACGFRYSFGKWYIPIKEFRGVPEEVFIPRKVLEEIHKVREALGWLAKGESE